MGISGYPRISPARPGNGKSNPARKTQSLSPGLRYMRVTPDTVTPDTVPYRTAYKCIICTLFVPYVYNRLHWFAPVSAARVVVASAYSTASRG